MSNITYLSPFILKLILIYLIAVNQVIHSDCNVVLEKLADWRHVFHQTHLLQFSSDSETFVSESLENLKRQIQFWIKWKNKYLCWSLDSYVRSTCRKVESYNTTDSKCIILKTNSLII